MSKFKVGDKVRIVSKWPKGGTANQNGDGYMDKWLGKVMTIREVCSGWYRMEEDRGDPFSELGWYWWPAAVEGLVNQKIVVTTDGVTTTARLFSGKELVKTAIAKCSPADNFDFKIGAGIAVSRLLNTEEKTEPEAPKFPRGEMKPGIFGRMNNGTWFVVVEDRMVYVAPNGGLIGFDYVRDVDDAGELGFAGRAVDYLVQAVSFANAEGKIRRREHLIWSRPGAKF